MPQNTVHSILQTSDGYLWLATLDGLARYDGVKFTVFNKNNTPGISSNRFTQLILDGRGDLWVGTEYSGVTRYHQGVFQTYQLDDNSSNYPIWRLALNRAGELVVFTQNGIVEWDGAKFAPYAPIAGETKESLIWWSRDGAFWRANGPTLHRFQGGQTSVFRLPGAAADATIHDFFEDRRGRLWLGTINAGLFVWENEKLAAYTVRDGLPSNRVSPRVEDQEGNLWAVTTAGAVIIKDGQVSRLTTAQGLSDNILTAVYEDRENNIWIGTLHRGLNRLNRQSVTFYAPANGLPMDRVYPVYQDREGGVWLGNQLTRYRAGGFARVAGAAKFLGSVTAFAQDHAGRLWLGHWGGVYYYENGGFTDFGAKFGEKVSVMAIHEDRAGVLWFGSSGGLFRWADHQMTRLTPAQGLASNDVKVLLEASDGALWVGTYGGLTRIKEDARQTFTVHDGLASNLVRSLYQDAAGALWIGSYDGGLTRLQDGKFTRYTTREGLFNDGVFQILEDERGNLWMSCNRGVYRVAKQELNDFAAGKIARLNSLAVGKADGLRETECNGGQQPAGIKARDGRLWFPTQGGVAVINPNAIAVNLHAPPVHIEAITLNGVTSPASGAPVEISPDIKNLGIAYTGLSFIKPEQVRFKYKMNGLDGAWVEADTRRAAYYSYLPPGEYTFTVIAANSDGVWNLEGASVRVRVVPPFYRAWWFVSLATLGVLGLAYFFYQRRVAQWRLEQARQETFSRRLLESQERERGRIAAELHDGLSQSLVIIKNRAALSLTTPEDAERAFEQLEEISAAASEAMLEAKEMIYNLRPVQLDRFGLTKAVRALLKKVNDTQDITFTMELDALDGLLAKDAESSLYRMLQESVNNVARHSQATQAYVSLKRADGFITLLVKDNGQGFTPGATRHEENQTGGFGLVGLAERARLLQGEAAIQSAPGCGTTVKVTLPWRAGVS